MPTGLAAPVSTFFVVPLRQLEPATVLGFDLFMRHGKANPVLYRSRELEFSPEVQERLVENGVSELFVPADQQSAYEAYIERHRPRPQVDPAAEGPDERRLGEALTDENIPLRARGNMLLGVSRTVVRIALQDLSSPGLDSRVHKVAESTARFLLEVPGGYASLVREMRLNLDAYEHAVHTSLYATELARASGMDGLAEMTALGRAALLHDIGATDLPVDLAHRWTGLDATSRPRIVGHVERGLERLAAAGVSDPVCQDVCRGHHERCDGSGYPRGLTGAEIPLPAQIVAIADVFDVLTSATRNRVALSGKQALWRMSRDMTGQFEPRLLAAFIQSLVQRPA